MILASATFVCLALLLAGRLRAESTLALANLIYVILLIGGALIIPLERYPSVLQPLIQVSPTAALGERAASRRKRQLLGWPVVVLLAWLVAAGLAAWKGFHGRRKQLPPRLKLYRAGGRWRACSASYVGRTHCELGRSSRWS